ncbi:MAG: sulfotransferase [Bacteroidales bacterium]|nr:sulfotransferase [Bacteroidales bacterium]
MKKNYHNNPYIILGVHRSGTTLMSDIFSRLGIFMGKNQNINKEAKFFFQLNNKTLKENDSTAYDFDIFLEKLNDEQFINRLSDKFKNEIQKNINAKFFGFKQLLKYQFQNKKIKWGFKDPRTVLLYSVWKKIFPDAKYLIITRNPVDVSMSIYYFEQKRYLKKLKKRPDLEFGMPLTKAFDVWKKFTLSLLKIYEDNNTNFLMVKYEELKNTETLDKIIQFCNSNADSREINKIIKNKPSNYKIPEGYSQFINRVKNDELVQKLYPELNF